MLQPYPASVSNTVEKTKLIEEQPIYEVINNQFHPDLDKGYNLNIFSLKMIF